MKKIIKGVLAIFVIASTVAGPLSSASAGSDVGAHGKVCYDADTGYSFKCR